MRFRVCVELAIDDALLDSTSAVKMNLPGALSTAYILSGIALYFILNRYSVGSGKVLPWLAEPAFAVPPWCWLVSMTVVGIIFAAFPQLLRTQQMRMLALGVLLASWGMVILAMWVVHGDFRQVVG